MAYGIIKELARGQVHMTASAVYSAPVGKTAEVAGMWFHNASTSAQQVLFAFPANETGSRRFNESIGTNETYEISPKVPFILSNTGSIFIQAANSASVNYIIFGREEV